MKAALCILLLVPLVAGTRFKEYAMPETPQPNVAWGLIQRIPSFESKWIGSRTIDILLPEEYPAYPAKRYPVLYMHDGQMLFDSSHTWNHKEWKVDEAMRDFFRKTEKSCIVVAIHHAGQHRYAEYFPKKPFEALPPAGRQMVLNLASKDSNRVFPRSEPHSDRYLKFLVEELKPMMDQTFRTLPGRENTSIAGSSMGGLISLYALCEYPKVFGAAACLSTHWPGIFQNRNNPVPAAFLRYLQKSLPRPGRHRLYLDCGTSGLDSLYPVHHRKAVVICRLKGYRSTQLREKIIEGATHSETAWQQRMPEVLDFLLQRSEKGKE
jgi:predicted alpha/beta superfamily hydrolase